MPDLDVAVVGAGMAGLTAADELARSGLSVRVFETGEQVGGRMAGFRHRGYTVDTGAEQISPSGYRATWELLARLGFRDRDVPRLGGRISVWRGRRARPGVAEARGMLTGAGLGLRGRADLARFQAWARRHRHLFDGDHPETSPLGTTTLAELGGRYHRDLHDYLLQPVAGTFFGWDPQRSAAAPMVSLLLDVGDASRWRTYRGGMDTAARMLAARLDVRTGQTVRQVVSGTGSAQLLTDAGAVSARAVLLCVPAPVAARLHANPTEQEARYLAAATFHPAVKVSCLLHRPLAPRGGKSTYVLLTPAVADGALSAIIFDHRKHPDRAPAGAGLLTLMPARAATASMLDRADSDVAGTLTAAAERYLPGLAGATWRTFVHRFPHGLPEATPAVLRQRAGFAARPTGPVDFAGDWVLQRPSSEAAVRSGALAASRTRAHLSSRAAVPVRVR
ncbi:protoporphyrinogen/coproporphyrinogen oxidase [Saccharopolyspora montiporae]